MLFTTLASIILCLLFSLPASGKHFDYTIDIYYGTNFQGSHLAWPSHFGECGSPRATYADLQNTTMSPEYAYEQGIHFGGFHVGSVRIPKGVGCTVYTEDTLCLKETYQLNATATNILPDMFQPGGIQASNTWMSWRCWSCDWCGKGLESKAHAERDVKELSNMSTVLDSGVEDPGLAEERLARRRRG